MLSAKVFFKIIFSLYALNKILSCIKRCVYSIAAKN